ncbi:MAG: hypothetical protein GX181_05220 [Synergistaceae bacterium]|nr:hypothetical protein [Synergistota bacterium]NLM71341.1 hypothetical protein [Synergistaceae bacterium]
MSLKPCKICGRLYDSARGKYCPQCLQDIDDFYPKVREYIRDSRDVSFSVDSISEEMGVDILRVQALVDLGYLDRDVPGISGQIDEEKRKREELARKLQGALDSSPTGKRDKPEDAKKHRTYGQERYGTRDK